MEQSTITQKSYALPTLIISSIIAILGSLLIIPFNHEPSLGLTLWFLFILIGDIIILKKILGRLQFSVFNLILLLSYACLTFSFITNTKLHFFTIFFLLVLLPVLNFNLANSYLNKNFINRYFIGGIYYIGLKFKGLLFFMPDVLKQLSTRKDITPSKLKGSLTALKTLGLFLVTGLPLTIIVIALLKSSNPEFNSWVNRIFSTDLSIETFIARAIFFIFFFILFITEYYFVKEISRTELLQDIQERDVRFTKEIKKNWLLMTVVTMTILNLFFIPFIYFEIKYDFGGNLRDLVLKKGLDSYSRLAVGRFWQLIFVSIINLGIIYLVAKPFRIFRRKSKLITTVFLVNSLLLFVNSCFLIFSVYKRLSFYQEAYGWTNKRALAFSFLPVLVIVIILCFGALLSKYRNKLFQASFGLVVLFFSIFAFLPTEYIINKANLELAKQNRIKVYDAAYALPYNSVERYQSCSSRERSISIIRNDTSSYDGAFVAVEALDLNEQFVSSCEKNYLRNNLKKIKQDISNTSWREFNISKILLRQKLKDLSL